MIQSNIHCGGMFKVGGCVCGTITIGMWVTLLEQGLKNMRVCMDGVRSVGETASVAFHGGI